MLREPGWTLYPKLPPGTHVKGSNAPIPASYAARPLVEADLIAVIGDAGINQARTPAEVLAHLSALRPFIELADLALPPDQKPTAESIAAVNVGARLGVLGEPIAIDPGIVERLATMKVSLADGTGKVLAEAPGAAILGHPLNAVIWLAQDLAHGARRCSRVNWSASAPSARRCSRCRAGR